MLKRLSNIVLSCWLAILLVFGGTAKEFVHSFCDHVDTVHTRHKRGELSFEKAHHHCSFLSYSLSVFISHSTSFPEFTKQEEYNVADNKIVCTCYEQTVSCKFLRGPPFAV